MLPILCSQQRCSRVLSKPRVSPSAAQKPNAPSPTASTGADESAVAQIGEDGCPGVLALAVAGLDGKQVFLAIFGHSDQNQQTELLVLAEPDAHVHAVGEEVDVPIRDLFFLPEREIFFPGFLEQHDAGRAKGPVTPSPRKSVSAERKSPVESPFRYRIGSRFSTFGDLRMYAGRI